MSTKTNFKRIALVAVAALGIGVLSSVPSIAAAPTIACTTAADTTNCVQAVGGTAKLTVTLVDNGVETKIEYSGVGSVIADTGTFAAQRGNPLLSKSWVDTTSVANQTDAVTFTSSEAGVTVLTVTPLNSSGTPGTPVTKKIYWTATGALTASSVTLKMGDYSVYTTAATGTWANLVDTTVAVTRDKAAGSNQVAIAARFLDASGLPIIGGTVVVSLTGSGVLSATVPANETATTTANSSVRAFTATTSSNGTVSTAVGSDGSAGVGTVTFTLGTVSASKSVTFSGAAASYVLTAGAGAYPVGAYGVNDTKNATVGGSTVYGIRVQPKDAALNTTAEGTTFYAYSSDESVATVSSSARSTIADKYGYVAVTGAKAGKTTITIANASTLATSTVKQTVEIEVTSSVASTVTMTTDKATYKTGEAGVLTIELKNAAGRPVADGTYTIFNALAPLASNVSVTADNRNGYGYAGGTSVTTEAGKAVLEFYAPSNAGTLKFTGTTLATGTASLTGSALGASLTATAEVTDAASAALAAVTALATTVASLRSLITTLTNLVLKIQKKVKA